MMNTDNQATINLAGLRLPWKTTTAIVVSTLLLMVDYYYNIARAILPSSRYGDPLRVAAIERIGLYLVIPLLVVVVVFREKPESFGFTIGNWREGLKWVLLFWVLSAPVLYVVGRTPDMATFYALYRGELGDVILTTGLDLFGWEFLFRGFLLFALYRVAGPSAVVLQAVPFALAHLSKPPLETLSTIFGGTAFGWVAWRANSFLYAFLIHWFVHVVVVIAATTV